MTTQDDYKAKLDVIQAIGDNETTAPTMPVDVFIQEAENLYRWCQDDKEGLTGAGLDWALVEDLQVRTGACREAQSIWFQNRFTHEEAQKEWDIKSPEAYDLRDKLIQALRYAYRKDPILLGRVSEIRDGWSHADMIQDLNDIAVLGKDNPEPLEQINLDLALLDAAALTADEMGDLLAKSTTDRGETGSIKIVRDKAYTHLKEAVDEIRACGKYVFANNGERRKGYTSAHYRKHNSPGRSAKNGSGKEYSDKENKKNPHDVE